MGVSALKELFFPQSICIAGASRDPSALGHIILKNLLGGGYAGKIFPVNPHAESILGMRCYSSVKEIPGRVDLAIIAVPAGIVSSVLMECGGKRIPYAVIITAGFREAGEKGRTLENEVLRIAQDYGIRIVGPNCMGVYNSHNNLSATFTSLVPKQGGISFISQSGAVGTTMLAWAKKEGIGFSKFVSVGNEADLSLPEFLKYLADDESTKVITIYMESVRDGRLLIEAFRSASSKKPVIVMKVGTTPAGASAAVSHTGAMAVEDAVLDGVLKQFCIIRARDPAELFGLAASFETLPLPRGRSVAVVASGGGWAVECADLIEVKGLRLKPLPMDALKLLDRILPTYWSRKNPIDTVAVSDAEAYYIAVKALLERDYDMVFLIGYGVLGSIALPTLIQRDVDFAVKISHLVKKYKKPMYVVDVLGPSMSDSARAFERSGLSVFATVKSAVDVAAEMVRYSEYRGRQKQNPRAIIGSA
jgi:acyl-CoA synthetase (NDP forming)